MAIIFVDNKKYNVNQSDNLLKACLSSGINIPYFCWHPILGSIGACRQCAVTKYNDKEDTIGQLVMSCMTPVVDGAIISTHDDMSNNFRKGIIELLMINHPHDCPVCEEGGSCHLQDMTVMTSHIIRRYRFSKRTHKNQYLGPFINHEMNRCISCYRCIRYYKDYSDGKDLGVFGIGKNVYFGRLEDGFLKSEFSGNLVEVCPTGVFTDKTYSKRYNRKWDMQYSPSVCQHCSLGCNVSIGEKFGKICRVENRYHNSLNHYFLCDMGRFSYDYSNVSTRLKNPIYRYQNHEQTFLNVDETIKKVSQKLKISSKIIGIGSCRASVENNFALQKLVGIENFSIGVLKKEHECLMLIKSILKCGQINIPTLREIENYDTIFILGEDITQTSPLIALSIRQCMKKDSKARVSFKDIPIWHSEAIKNSSINRNNKLFIMNIDKSALDDISDESYFSSISDQISIGIEVYRYLKNDFKDNTILTQQAINFSKKVAQALISSKRPLLISGSHSHNADFIKISFNIAKILKDQGKDSGLILLSSSANSLGVSLLGGLSIEEIIDKVMLKKVNQIIILENDLYRYLPESIVDTVFKLSRFTVVIDHISTRTLKKADMAIPACNSFEQSGTVVNYEGRAQRFFQVYEAKFYGKNRCVLASWRWLHFLYCQLYKKNVHWLSLDNVISDISSQFFDFKELKNVSPTSDFKILKQKLARSPHRISGRTAMYSNINIHEPKQPQDVDTMFSFSMEGCQNISDYSTYIPFSWKPGWNSSQAWNKFKKIDHGHYGRILFKKSEGSLLPYYKLESQGVQKFEKSEYLIVPYYILFCNNELSQESPVVKENILISIGIMNVTDANKLSITSGSTIEFLCLNQIFVIKIRLSDKFQQGQLGLPLGIPNFPFFLADQKIKVLRKIIT